MARSHGRTATSIWSDTDFLALEEGPQRLYLFLLSQPDLSHAGLLPMRIKKWAAKTPSLSPGAIRDRLNTLDAYRFIVIDEDTEEVLIRTMVRNDGVYKQPKVMVRMREDAMQIESPRLRASFKVELERLPMDELSSNPSGQHHDGPSTREQVQAVVDTLRSDFAEANGYPSVGVSDTPHVRAGALPHPPTPYPQPPSPTPSHTPPSADAAAPASAVAVHVRSKFNEFWDAYGKKVGKDAAEKAFNKAAKKVDAAILIQSAHEHADHHERIGTESRFIPHPSKWLNEGRWADERTAKDERGPRSARQAETDTMFDSAMQRAVERDRNAG